MMEINRLSQGIRRLVVILCVVCCGMLFVPMLLQAQTIAEWFEKFPYLRGSVSLTSSPTNAVLLDMQNNYLRVTSITPTDTLPETPIHTTTTVFKMFLSEDGTQNFAYQIVDDEGKGNGCLTSTTKFFVVQDDGEWKDITSILMPSVRLTEFYGKKSVPNLMDVGGVISFTPEHNRAGIGLGVVLELPQKGSVIQARLMPRCNRTAMPEYTQLLAECKYKTLELQWDAAHTWFIIGKKLEK